MTAPLQILCVSAQPVDLWGSSYGPFVVQHCTTLEEAAQALQNGAHDAVLLEMPTPAALAGLLGWPNAIAANTCFFPAGLMQVPTGGWSLVRLLMHGPCSHADILAELRLDQNDDRTREVAAGPGLVGAGHLLHSLIQALNTEQDSQGVLASRFSTLPIACPTEISQAE